MYLHSDALGERVDERFVYNGYGCHGENLSPPLDWGGAPQETESFALIVHDPDAPRPGGWWHWIVFDIPRVVHRIPEGAGAFLRELGAVESVTSFGTPGYGGPCPPVGHGPHRYVFSVFAMPRARLPLRPDTSPAVADAWIREHALDSASLISHYQR
ncbi:YbhB/YbcL family Raf kinase inhibitor-like protein [Sulfurivirga sp.]|uniref:YbhB/YbcL family Raf kinase inhibitor-like protein n=1 Tax=Sulfurivirga sp. TaxID=2614236 RepID=UPI0025F474C1|nr:YbhB/YbcL family Raf kinase inhibitor-like protein [Sulfurivirga sp.]